MVVMHLLFGYILSFTLQIDLLVSLGDVIVKGAAGVIALLVRIFDGIIENA